MREPLLHLAPNRVRRTYRGGALLDRLDGNPAPRDDCRPEDWLASDVAAINPGMDAVPGEGLAQVLAASGEIVPLAGVLESDPEYYMGARHVERQGSRFGFLAKLLDAAVRLPLQAHPTTAFAREQLGAPYGKLETYVILGLREGADSRLRLGFQRPPSPEEWKRIVLEQDIAAMEACFDPIPVQVGEVWLVPGGWPHAIGEGILLLEIMEPSDLVVRCEFERDGLVIPPEARFMGRPIDLALSIFDYQARSVQSVLETCRVRPLRLNPREELLIGPEQTRSFSVARWTIEAPAALPAADLVRLGVVVRGHGLLTVEERTVPVAPGARFLIAAAARTGRIVPADGAGPLEILVCSPGDAKEATVTAASGL